MVAVRLPFLTCFSLPDLTEERLVKVMWAETDVGGEQQRGQGWCWFSSIHLPVPRVAIVDRKHSQIPFFNLSKTKQLCYSLYRKKQLNNNLYL